MPSAPWPSARWPSLVQLKSLSDAYAVSVVDASHKVRNGGFSWAEGAAARWVSAWRDRQGLDGLARHDLPAGGPPARMTDARARKRAADDVVTEASRIMAAQDRAALDHLVTRQLYQAIDPLTESIGALLDAQIAQADVAVGLSSRRRGPGRRDAIRACGLDGRSAARRGLLCRAAGDQAAGPG